MYTILSIFYSELNGKRVILTLELIEQNCDQISEFNRYIKRQHYNPAYQLSPYNLTNTISYLYRTVYNNQQQQK